MRIKQILPVVAIVLMPIICQSQKISVKVGPELEAKKIIQLMDPPKLAPVRLSSMGIEGQFFNVGENRTYSLFEFMENRRKFLVSDNYVNPVGNAEFSAETLGKDEKQTIRIVALNNNNGKLYILYTANFAKTDKMALYVNEVNKDLVVMGTPILVQEYSDLRNSYVAVATKSDNGKYTLIYRLAGADEAKLKMDIKVVDDSFAEVWGKTFDISLKSQGMQEMMIDNDGNAYFVISATEGKISTHTVHSYAWKTQGYKTAKMGAGLDMFGVNYKLLNSKLYAVGLVEKNKDVSWFIDRFDIATGTSQRLSTNSMGPEFYKAANDRQYKTSYWKVGQLVSTANNNLVASVEAQMQTITSGHAQYFANNTYVMGFTEDGALKYQHTLYKVQVSYDQSVIGQKLIPFGNKVLLVYNDVPGNLQSSPTERKVHTYPGIKEVMGMVQEIDETGKVTKRQITTDANVKDFSVNIPGLTRIKDNMYYVPLIKRSNNFSFKAKFMTMTIE